MRVYLRDANSSAATDLEEIRANAFAAAVMMPRDPLIAAARPALQKV